MDIHYKITFHTYWHCGSGLASGADADLLVIKDKDGLPYVPGKTIKGLVREAIDLLAPEKMTSNDYKSVFGISGATGNGSRSMSFFGNATYSKKEHNYIASKGLPQYLYQTISSTAITDEGVADDNTLRKIQVSIPSELDGYILNVPENIAETIKQGLKYIKRLGAWRNRGLGRCTFEITEPEKADEDKSNHSKMGTLLKFKCELLTDVILNQKSASEGTNTTLDFIPGSNFLGIVAAGIYGDKAIDDVVKLKIFHTKAVRFGDAHPANGDNRSLRMPACLYFPKGAEEEGRKYYVHHEIKDASSEDLRKIQLKQERSGFVDFLPLKQGKDAVRFKVNTDYAIKSAYNRELRCSLDKQMFGYQSMGKGMTYFFTVEIDSSLSAYAERIKKELEGKHRIGRSRSAQYGLVDICLCDFNEPESSKDILKAGSRLTIYADSRLVFLDEDNLPTFQPTPKQLTGNVDDIILWDKCQLRTFQYAPYNYQRRCFDTDRCGFEKGSVFVIQVKNETDISKLSSHLGSYQNEGFGKVIYNTEFFKANDKGVLEFSIKPKDAGKDEDYEDPKTLLTNFISKRRNNIKESAAIYEAVNKWVNDHQHVYAKKSFASQWGKIRDLALQSDSSSKLWKKLFKGENDNSMRDHDKGYLVHGVAKEKWEGKTQALKDFINSHSPKAVVNLASEMQKKC